jgi:DNA-directed RNA polymerase specialized sigma24 family protein
MLRRAGGGKVAGLLYEIVTNRCLNQRARQGVSPTPIWDQHALFGAFASKDANQRS